MRGWLQFQLDPVPVIGLELGLLVERHDGDLERVDKQPILLLESELPRIDPQDVLLSLGMDFANRWWPRAF